MIRNHETVKKLIRELIFILKEPLKNYKLTEESVKQNGY